MKVNTAKTNLLVVSDAQTFTPLAEIEDSEGNTIRSTGTMKVLGFHMSDRPTVAAQVEALRKRLRQRYWILFHLKNYGFSQQELCKVYRNVIRPIADYCCVVYHSMLTDEQDEVLERCQAHALRCIFGKDVPYAKMREKAGVTTLRASSLRTNLLRNASRTSALLAGSRRKQALERPEDQPLPKNTRRPSLDAIGYGIPLSIT